MRVFFKIAVLLLPVVALAIEVPLKDPIGLRPPIKKEKMVRVSSSKVILADYDLLKKDFPILLNKSNQEIDAWLLQYTSFISKAQTEQSVVNTSIPIAEEIIEAWRPAEYGRAAVFPIGEEALIDAKGIGSPLPTQGNHSNGLSTLGEDIREYIYEKLIDKIFKHSHSGYETVGSYAVIDYGFNVKHADGSQSPAGYILRQAHDRYESRSSLFNEKDSLKIEKILRRYGITSAGAHQNIPVDGINIQGTRGGAVLDFGSFLSMERFKKPLQHFWGNKILLSEKSRSFVQPDDSFRVPFELWGYSKTGIADPKQDNPWIWSHELAENLRNGNATRADVEQHVLNLLSPVDKRLQEPPFILSPNSCLEGFKKISR